MVDKKDEGEKVIIYYCKDCEKVVNTHQVGRKFVYKCALCGTKNVAFGTDRSIKNFFRIKEDEAPVEVKKDVEKKEEVKAEEKPKVEEKKEEKKEDKKEEKKA
jgi:hypothetical protein